MATFCLIHGAWHESSCWHSVAQCLQVRGHESVAPELPLDDPNAGFEERVRPALRALEDADDVVVVGHSQGSAYATQVAVAHPGSLLVYLCPRLAGLEPPAGAPDMFRPRVPFPEDRPDGTSVWDSEQAIAAMYRRLPAETARELAQRLRPMAPPADEYPVPDPSNIPTALVYATDDEFFEPAWERFMAREVLGIEPIEIPGGHFPMAEDPDALADLLDRLAHEHTGGNTTSRE